MNAAPVHMMRATSERGQFVTRCGTTTAKATVTVWESDVTCPRCVLPTKEEQ